MPERIAGLGLDVAEHEVMDVAADEAVDDEAHLEAVGEAHVIRAAAVMSTAFEIFTKGFRMGLGVCT